MNWLFIVTLLIIGGGAFLGWRAGFVKTVFSLVSTIAVIILTLIFSPIVTNMLKNNETIFGTISSKLDLVINLPDTEQADATTDAFIDGLSLPESIKNSLKSNESVSEYAGAQLEELEGFICDLLTGIIINAIGFIVTFLVAAIALAVLCFILNVISRLPVLHQINTMAGVAAGALEGLMVVWIFFIVITMFGTTEFGSETLALISENPILSFLYDSNILSGFITK